MRAELPVLMLQHNRRRERRCHLTRSPRRRNLFAVSHRNRRAKDVAEGVMFIRGGIGRDVPTEPERVEVRTRAAIGQDDD